MKIGQEKIGIQFNFKESKRLSRNLNKKDFEITSDHIDVLFSKKELKRINSDYSRKLNPILFFLNKCLHDSSYTNIYTYLDANKLQKIKPKLLENEFNDERIRITKIVNKNSFIENFENHINSPKLLNLIKKHPLMVLMDKIVQQLVQRDFALNQKLTLEVGFEDKNEWGTDRDNINISIQFDEEK